jgi:hypothetical protein
VKARREHRKAVSVHRSTCGLEKHSNEACAEAPLIKRIGISPACRKSIEWKGNNCGITHVCHQIILCRAVFDGHAPNGRAGRMGQ